MEFLDFLDEEIKHTYKHDNCKSKFKIKDIFNDHWYSFLEDNPNLNIRPVVYEEVEKMMMNSKSNVSMRAINRFSSNSISSI